MSSLEKINEIFFLYEKYGKYDYIGEEISQLEHMIQAAMLAEEDGQPEFVILAALFHDIGHLVVLDTCDEKDNLGAKNHEHIGSLFLSNQGIPEPIPHLVKSHVLAKRFLVSVQNFYYDTLSLSSQLTLKQQGGKLSEMECKSFKSHHLYNEMVKIRLYDDNAKVKDKRLKPLEYYKQMCIKYLKL